MTCYSFVMVAGGTGGHMMPAEAVSDQLAAMGHDISLITDKRGDAFKTIMRGYPRTVLKTGHMSSSGPIGKLQLMVNLLKFYRQCLRIFKDKRPDVVIGFGGYPSLPAMKAAVKLGIPTLLHEQNAVLGRSNRALAKQASGIALSFENTGRIPAGSGDKAVVTGNPIREEIVNIARTPYALDTDNISVLIVGGSLGATILSKTIAPAIAALPQELRAKLKVTHQARAEDVSFVTDTYAAASIEDDVAPFFDNIPEKLEGADLIICRAGASSVVEASVSGRPAIFIPLSIATDDHQRANAEAVTKHGGGWIILEQDLSVDLMKEQLMGLLQEPSRLKHAAEQTRGLLIKDASKRLAELVLSLVKR